mgnify:CR=1 FL=1
MGKWINSKAWTILLRYTLSLSKLRLLRFSSNVDAICGKVIKYLQFQCYKEVKDVLNTEAQWEYTERASFNQHNILRIVSFQKAYLSNCSVSKLVGLVVP